MISYKDFKKLNESFVGLAGGVLGVRSTPSLGLVGAHSMTAEELLDEAKKKAKKMLAGSGEGPSPGDSGDGEVVPAKAVKDEPDDDDPDGDGIPDDKDPKDKLDTDDDGDGALEAPKFAKKKMSADDKCSKCGHSPCTCDKDDLKKKFKESLAEEMERDFFANLKSMMTTPRARDFRPVSEEILLPSSDPNAGLVAQDAVEPVSTEPAPGEVGFAPDTRFGFGYSESVKKK